MKKFYSLLLMAVVFATTCYGETALFDFHNNALSMFDGITAASSSSSTDGDFTTSKSTVVSGVTLTVNPSNANTANRIWNDYNLGLQLRIYGGSFSFSAPTGKVVTNIAFNTSTWNAPTASTGIVGDNSWSGSASTVTFTAAGQIRINSITVTFGEGSGVTPDPTVAQVDSLYEIEYLDDDTEFQFTTETYVNYQNGKYLYIQQTDDESYCFVGLIYGEIGKTYQMGDIIPAGWKGKKTTFRDLVEVIEVTDLQDANGSVDPYWTEPFDYTGYLDWIDETFMNYKVSFNKVTISDINKQNFTITETDEDGNTTSIAGYNQFRIELPAEGDYYLEGMVSIHNGTVQIYPIFIGVNEQPLWEVLYYNADGDKTAIADELYVEYADEEKQLIFVTDNCTEIYLPDYDFTMDWYPDWIAIDCSNSSELFDAIRQMEVIEAGTLTGTVQDMKTNPRIVVETAPIASENTKPEIVYNDYSLIAPIYPNPHEVLYISGKFNDGNLEGFVDNGDETSFTQSVTMTPTADLQDYQFVNGNTYTLRAYATIKEAWTDEESESAPKAAPMKRKAAKPMRKAPARRVGIEDPNWFTNYEIHAFEVIDEITGVNGISTDKTIAKVTYINALGQAADSPFTGVNIIITRYTDGTSSATKVVK